MKGLGHDFVEVDRIKECFDKRDKTALDKIFTEEEQTFCLKHQNPWPHFAGKFAAKEAVVKALGTGFRNGIHFLDIEIQKDPLGKPFVVFSPKLLAMFDNPHILVSISHTKEHASAIAFWN